MTLRKVFGSRNLWEAVTSLAAFRAPIVALAADVDVAANSATFTIIEDGTTDGYLKTDGPSGFKINGQLYNKAGTDNLWNLSAQTDTTGAQYRAYWLYLDSSGTATIAAGANAASSVAAIAALPALAADKAVMGVYVAGLSTDFNGAAGLAAQGTIIYGVPAALAQTYTAPTAVTPTDP
jgi:hypothetical protein